jgi:2-oxo-3-hexenedioate decarboxylase/2-keto-4-pentenoate hydratase
VSEARLASAAMALLECRRAGTPFAGFPAALAPRSLDEGYAIHARVSAALSGGAPPAGHKIGCTTPVMQAYLGIHHPCAGVILAGMAHRSPATVSTAGHGRLGVECELAVRLGGDLEPASVMAAIEIVEDRYVDFRALDAATLVADNFFGTACVLGADIDPASVGDLAAARASMAVDGQVVGSGEGVHILGEPLAALRWLRETRAAQGAPLRPGEIVLLGSIVETRWVEPGNEVVVRNDPLGEVVVRFLP